MHRVQADEIPAVAATLAVGFAEDPWFRWLWPGDGYEACARDWFGLVASVAVPMGPSYATDDGTAAALWIPPGEVLTTPDNLAAAAALLRSQVGERAGDVLAALGASAVHEPADPHFACTYVAVRPEARGRGQGEAVMRPALDAADAGRFPAYLVSTNERNLPFYRRLGFEVTTDVPVAGGAVTFRPMWRPPAGPRA